jgi:protein arginine N-methyltransferase 2
METAEMGSPQHDMSMLEACSTGNLSNIQSILKLYRESSNDSLVVSLQDDLTGLSPLMVAAKHGHIDTCKFLLEEGAPWNAIDREGKCAGDYATENEHWEIVNVLVDAGTKAELILGASIRLSMKNNVTSDGLSNSSQNNDASSDNKNTDNPVEFEPCTKPDYLKRNVRYDSENTLLLDDDDDAVMMQWERPLMDAHASIITGNGEKNKTVLNIGFGLGIIDTALQKYDPALHVIIEAHPMVHQKMVKDGWDKKTNVRICFGRWQDELPKLIAEGITFDGIFYDTYGEHFTDLEDFHSLVSKTLKKPDGVYSFFNGLAPDNLFFHGVGEFWWGLSKMT